MGRGDARVRIGGDTRGLDRALSGSRAKIQRWAAGVAKDIGGALRGAFSGLGTIAGFGGMAALTMATRQTIEYEKRLTRLGIAARMPQREVKALGEKVRTTASAMGLEPTELLQAVETLMDATGNLDLVTGSLGTMTDVMATSGAGAEDVAKLVAALSTLGLTGQGIRDATNAIVGMGKTGSIPLKDLAGNFAEVSSELRGFAGWAGGEGANKVSALFQLLGPTFANDAARTRTAVNALARSFKTVATIKRLQGAGVKVFDVKDGKKQLRGFEDIVEDIGKKTKGDPVKLRQLLGGSSEAAAALEPLLRAGRVEFEKYVAAGEESAKNDELAQDAKTWQESAAGRLLVAQERLNEAMATLVNEHMPKIVSAAEAFADAIKWAAEHAGTLAAIFAALKIVPPIMKMPLPGGGAAPVGAAGAAGAGAAGAKATTVGGRLLQLATTGGTGAALLGGAIVGGAAMFALPKVREADEEGWDAAFAEETRRGLLTEEERQQEDRVEEYDRIGGWLQNAVPSSPEAPPIVPVAPNLPGAPSGAPWTPFSGGLPDMGRRPVDVKVKVDIGFDEGAQNLGLHANPPKH